jgi:hypothetical protein
MPFQSGYHFGLNTTSVWIPGDWPECHKYFNLIVGNFFDLKTGNWSEYPPRPEHRKLGLNTASCIDLNFGSFFDLKIGNWSEYPPRSEHQKTGLNAATV